SIFTAKAGRVMVAGSPAIPVSGETGVGATVVAVVVVELGCVDVDAGLLAAALPPQAATNDTSTSTRNFVRTHATVTARAARAVDPSAGIGIRIGQIMPAGARFEQVWVSRRPH